METMSTETSMDVGFWEKLGDGLSAFSEGVGKFLLRLFGSSNERYVRGLGYIRASAPGATRPTLNIWTPLISSSCNTANPPLSIAAS